MTSIATFSAATLTAHNNIINTQSCASSYKAAALSDMDAASGVVGPTTVGTTAMTPINSAKTDVTNTHGQVSTMAIWDGNDCTTLSALTENSTTMTVSELTTATNPKHSTRAYGLGQQSSICSNILSLLNGITASTATSTFNSIYSSVLSMFSSFQTHTNIISTMQSQDETLRANYCS